MSEDCVFCGIVAGRVPTAKVMEDEATLAFIPREPATEGHTLVVPKHHSRNIFDIAPADLERTILIVQRVAMRQRERLGCAGVSLFQANERGRLPDRLPLPSARGAALPGRPGARGMARRSGGFLRARAGRPQTARLVRS